MEYGASELGYTRSQRALDFKDMQMAFGHLDINRRGFSVVSFNFPSHFQGLFCDYMVQPVPHIAVPH